MTNLLIIAWTFPWVSIKRKGQEIIPSFSALTARVFDRFIEELNAVGQPVSRITDLCSGSGGPWLSLMPILKKRRISVILSDLYPPPLQPHPWCGPDSIEPDVANTAATSDDAPEIQYYSSPVDATRLPESLCGMRSLCGCFHHFRPDFAASILQDCIDKQLPVVVIETSARSIVQKCASVLFMSGMTLATPIAYPRTTPWYLWLLTYVFPLTLVCACFDGVASCSRAYHPDEMLAVAKKCRGAESYRWEAGVEKFYGLFSLVYMTGRPLAANSTPRE